MWGRGATLVDGQRCPLATWKVEGMWRHTGPHPFIGGQAGLRCRLHTALPNSISTVAAAN